MTRTALERLLVGLTVVVCLLAGTARAATPQRSSSEQRIRFARGTHSETLRGRVSRDTAMLYIVGAKAGQSMTVTLDGDAKTRFDLSGPKDTSGQAMASGETAWSGTLPDDGDYKIFVFTEDHATAPFTLTVSVK
jgi:hypothetical protein